MKKAWYYSSMFSYCAFTGHQPQLSLAELLAVVPDLVVDFESTKEGIVLFSSKYELNQSTIDRLGGTVMLAMRITSSALGKKDIPKLLVNELETAKKGKVTFSLRMIGFTRRNVLDMYRDCKEALRKAGRSSRYVGNERKPAQSVVLHSNGLLDPKKGCEIVALRLKQDTDTLLWIGRTIGAQNIDAYTKRDIEKPVRDTNIGLLPPKLAQIMLNLGIWAVANKPGAKEPKPTKTPKLTTPKHTVYDPFCGTGVIPMEALLLNWNVIGSDLSPKAVTDTQRNVDWWLTELALKKEPTVQVFKHDATKPFSPDIAPDVLVTETTLGPNLHIRSSFRDAQSFKKDIEAIEAAFIQNAAAVYPSTPIVCSFPVWYTSKGAIHLEKIWDVIAKLGYDVVLPTDTAATEKHTITYRRPSQFVGRQIAVLLPTR